jgi:phage major head subunit gpT-like protein
MANNTAAYVATLRGLTMKMTQAFETAQPFYPRVCMTTNSRGRDEQYGILGAVPQMKEWLGDRQASKLRAAEYTLVNREFQGDIEVEKNDMDDDRMGLYPEKFAELGQRAATHPDKLLMETLVAGESKACFDGQFFFDTDHSFGDSGSQSNDLTSQVASTSAVTAVEFKNAFDASVRKMLGYVDDHGEPLNQPVIGALNNLVVVVPLALRQRAYEAFETQLFSNTTNVVIDRPQVVVSPYLSSGVKFYTLYVGGQIKPFIFQQRRGLRTQIKDMDDNSKRSVQFLADARYAMGYGAWWNAALTTLTT